MSSALTKARKFIAVNGSYLFVRELLSRFLGSIRNSLIAHKLGTKNLHIGPLSFIRGLSYITIGDDFIAGSGLWLEAINSYRDQIFSPRIIIGNGVHISSWTHIGATHLIEIGDNTLIGSKVVLIDHNHGQYSNQHTSPLTPPSDRPLDSGRSISIGKNVWLGDGVVIMPGVSVGDGSVIGANSVVTSSIPENSVAVGIPAKIIKRFDFDNHKWLPAEDSIR